MTEAVQPSLFSRVGNLFYQATETIKDVIDDATGFSYKKTQAEADSLRYTSSPYLSQTQHFTPRPLSRNKRLQHNKQLIAKKLEGYWAQRTSTEDIAQQVRREEVTELRKYRSMRNQHISEEKAKERTLETRQERLQAAESQANRALSQLKEKQTHQEEVEYQRLQAAFRPSEVELIAQKRLNEKKKAAEKDIAPLRESLQAMQARHRGQEQKLKNALELLQTVHLSNIQEEQQKIAKAKAIRENVIHALEQRLQTLKEEHEFQHGKVEHRIALRVQEKQQEVERVKEELEALRTRHVHDIAQEEERMNELKHRHDVEIHQWRVEMLQAEETRLQELKERRESGDELRMQEHFLRQKIAELNEAQELVPQTSAQFEQMITELENERRELAHALRDYDKRVRELKEARNKLEQDQLQLTKDKKSQQARIAFLKERMEALREERELQLIENQKKVHRKYQEVVDQQNITKTVEEELKAEEAARQYRIERIKATLQQEKLEQTKFSFAEEGMNKQGQPQRVFIKSSTNEEFAEQLRTTTKVA